MVILVIDMRKRKDGELFWHEELERADSSVKDFIHMKARSYHTRKSYYSCLKMFSDFTKLEFDGLIKEGKKNRGSAEKRISEFLYDLKEKKLSGGTLGLRKTILVNFYEFNDVKINSNKLPNFDRDAIREDVVPSQEQLHKIFDAANARLRAVMALQAFSAIRFKGIKNLKLKHLCDLEVDQTEVIMKTTPMQVHIPKETDEHEPFEKKGAKHETFIIAEGCKYLKDYLDQRIRNEEKLTKESYVIAQKKGKQVSEDWLESMIREHFGKLGYKDVRPYVLKKYCENRMLATPEFKESYQKYFTGWKAGRELITRYGLAVSLSQEQIEQLRSEYSKTEPYLTTDRTVPIEDIEKLREKLTKELEEEREKRKTLETRLDFVEDWGERMNESIQLNVQMAEAVKSGNRDRLKELLASKENRRLVELLLTGSLPIDEKLLQGKEVTKNESENGFEHKLIPKNDEEQYLSLLNDGWEHYKDVNGKIVMRRKAVK